MSSQRSVSNRRISSAASVGARLGPGFTRQQKDEVAGWARCAVGEAGDRYPELRAFTSIPTPLHDKSLERLGTIFSSKVPSDSIADARSVLSEIEHRLDELARR